MYELFIITTANETYTKSQNYTNMVIGKHGIQPFKNVIVVLLFVVCCFCPHKYTHPFYFETSDLSKYT